MATAALPKPEPKELGQLRWVILAATKADRRTTPEDQESGGVCVLAPIGDGKTGDARRVLAMDTQRIHQAVVSNMSPLPEGCYAPPGWAGVDWVKLPAWTVNWRERWTTEDAHAEGRAGDVKTLFGYCRAAAAFAQSVGITPSVKLRGFDFPAVAVADAVAGAFDDIMGCELTIHELNGGRHVLAVKHALGEAQVFGGVDDEAEDTGDLEWDADPFVAWGKAAQ